MFHLGFDNATMDGNSDNTEYQYLAKHLWSVHGGISWFPKQKNWRLQMLVVSCPVPSSAVWPSPNITSCAWIPRWNPELRSLKSAIFSGPLRHDPSSFGYESKPWCPGCGNSASPQNCFIGIGPRQIFVEPRALMCTMAGNKKAKVFPDPVSAMPTCRVRFAAK
jgi:hypothetical protein